MRSKFKPLPDPLKMAPKKRCRKMQHGVDHLGSKRGSANERTACAFAWRVVAPSILSMPYTRTCRRSTPRVTISLFMTISVSMISVCWHGHVLDILRDGTHFACAEANGMHRNDLKHIIATKKSSTSLTSTRKCPRACVLGGGLAPNGTQRLST
jgi:hypothetical protein